ncbi:MAG: NUDIX domain-containing protein [Nitrospirales bacterium]|nr:NUDIX domain-containing protein [Nitrospirales bacterium]
MNDEDEGKEHWIQVAAALIEQDGRYLITQRKTDVHLAGLWEFPGGKRERGESLEACLRRELLEELAIEITSPVLFMMHRHAYPDKNVELHFFRCALMRGQPRALGCAGFCWVKPEDLSNYPFPPADAPVVARLRE